MKTKQIIAVVGLIALIGFGIMPLQKMASEQAALNQNLFLKKQQQIELVEKLEKIATSGSRETYIPNEPEELALANDLMVIGKKNGITIPENWNFKFNHNSDVGAGQISVSFPIQGRRQQIANFLSDIEKNSRFLGVKNFAIKTDSSASLVMTEMTVEIYGFFLGAK